MAYDTAGLRLKPRSALTGISQGGAFSLSSPCLKPRDVAAGVDEDAPSWEDIMPDAASGRR
jgi:hypothetical protein